VREDVTSIKGHKYVDATTIEKCTNRRTILEVFAM
jgi:hypothetical protein